MFSATLKPAVLLLLGSLLALPALAADPPTTMTADTQRQVRPEPQTPESAPAPAKTKSHWWNPLNLFKAFGAKLTGSKTGAHDDVLQYEGLSSRPWAAISADPPYMSNYMDCRVHHPQFGLFGN